MSYIDTHAHLDDERFDADLDAVLSSALQGGVAAVVCPGISAESSEKIVQLAESHPAVYAAVGIQPNYCAEADAGDWQRILDLAGHPKVVGLGETGLDRHWDYTPFDVQLDYFHRHLDLAAEHDLPVIIHCREADEDLLPILRQAAAGRKLRGVLHSFSSDRAVAEECVELGLYVSFSGSATYRNKKFEPLRRAAAAVPDNRILLETDSPYLVPHPLRGREKRNHPALIVHTAECLAELRGSSITEIAEQTTANARRLFGIE